MRRLKPPELRALWLRAQGHTYSEIGAITGWTYTKVNRCVTEGRRAFLDTYQRIDSGEECERWLPVLSAIVDGEATPDQIKDSRPHLRNCPACRATLKALHESSAPLAALFPLPLLVTGAGTSDGVPDFLLRLYEGIAGGLHERAVASITRTQAPVEASAAGKVAAVAAAAVAGGGYASMQDELDPHARSSHVRPAAVRHAAHAAPPGPPGRCRRMEPIDADRRDCAAQSSCQRPQAIRVVTAFAGFWLGTGVQTRRAAPIAGERGAGRTGVRP